MLSEYQIGFCKAHIFRAHDFIRAAFLEHPVLMNTRFVRECIATHDGFVALNLQARYLANQTTGGNQTLSLDARGAVEKLGARPHGHHNFFQRTVPCAFADSIDCAFDLTAASHHCRQ